MAGERYILTYGNKYCENVEESAKKHGDDLMHSATLDFLATQVAFFEDGNGKLPEDWWDSIFWKVKEV